MRKARFFNLPNTIVYIRIVLVFIIALLLVSNNEGLYLIAFFLIMILFILDYADGFLARKFKSVTGFGSILDIMGDRIVENVLWITFSFLGVIPMWVPIIIITRGFITDGIRNYAFSIGKTAFGKNTMMKSKIGLLVVSSRVSRAVYAIAKALTFSLLALSMHLSKTGSYNIKVIIIIANLFMFFTIALCLLRGLYVIIDGLPLFKSQTH